MPLRPLVELGVEEAYRIASDELGIEGLPPLEAIENEDWGRDLLLSKLHEMPDSVLYLLGLTKQDAPRDP